MPNEAALTIMTRNSRMPDSLAGDLDAECSACLMGARRLAELFDRYGRAAVEACFDAILDKTTETFRSELLSKIPDGEYVWEDYAEHDGVDPPRLHTQRITLTKTAPDGGTGWCSTSPAPRRRPRARSTTAATTPTASSWQKWLAPILRNLADTPERMAELDVNEGVVPLIEMRFPPPGTLLTPIFPAPTNARTFVILRLLGVLAGVLAKAVDGRMPADQETIRYTGVYGTDADGEPYLMREVLGGGSGGRYYADGEDTIHVVPGLAQPADRVHRVALPVHRRAARARRRLRRRRAVPRRARLREAHPDARATRTSCRSRTARSCPAGACAGGRAGRPFQVTIDPGGPDEREVDALADAEPVRGRRD